MIIFLTGKKLRNYKTHPEDYNYNDIDRHRVLDYIETNFPYWLLLNNNTPVRLIDNTELHIIKPNDVVIFHNSPYSITNEFLSIKCKKIQIVTDKPVIEGCESYVCYDPTIISKDMMRVWDHVLYPLPIGYKKCTPQWPIKNISCMSTPSTNACNIEILRKIFINLNITHQTESYLNTGDEHLFFHLRPILSISMKLPSHKTANRVYQSWYANIPAILTPNAAISNIAENGKDYLAAYNMNHIIQHIRDIIKNESMYYKLCDRCNERENENNHDVILKQWVSALKKYV